MSKYEVQHYTLCDGWVNTWHCGDDELEQFNTYNDAHDALNAFLEDTMESFKAGDLAEPYYRDDFRIVRVK